MFASISSYLWGSSLPTAPTENASTEDSNRMVEDLVADNTILTLETIDDYLMTRSLLSIPSTSDEEADWVFVSKKSGDSNEMGSNTRTVQTMSLPSSSYIRKSGGTLGKKQRIQNHAVQPPVTRSSAARNIPNSALQANNVLNALSVIRPQQKAQRRQKEMHLKLKQLERTNLAREVGSSSSHPNRRRSRYAPNLSSRAVNNRKC